MIIDCISDLHGHLPKLEGGDLLIISGDLTARDSELEHFRVSQWMDEQSYKHIIFIAGNHDNFCMNYTIMTEQGISYLCDSMVEYEGLKIWGTPWTLTFPGMNPDCKAFTVNTEDKLREKYAACPDDIDIIISHGPPYGILDLSKNEDRCGSLALRELMFRVKPKYLICGHIHECGGKSIDLVSTICINASIMNEYYQPVNKPYRIEI